MKEKKLKLRDLIPYGVSLRQIAKNTGISHPHVVYVFQGRRVPSLEKAERIAGYLGVSMDTFASLFRRQREVYLKG